MVAILIALLLLLLTYSALQFLLESFLPSIFELLNSISDKKKSYSYWQRDFVCDKTFHLPMFFMIFLPTTIATNKNSSPCCFCLLRYSIHYNGTVYYEQLLEKLSFHLLLSYY